MAAFLANPRAIDEERVKGQEAAEKNIWSSLLENVGSGKKLPEKNILVLGGSSESQKEFLDAFSSDPSVRRNNSRHWTKKAPIANDFALGYTYHDILDSDHEDVLARISLYLLADPSPSFTPLLSSILTPESIPNTMLVVLLDWSEPWSWLRQLSEWVRMLRVLLQSLSPECKDKMEEIMLQWRDKSKATTSSDGGDSEVSLPLGPGEWDSALGLPLCVVCQNADRMEALERERGWKEDEFDFVLQSLRTVLLKHGASLIYTIPSVPTQLQTLLHSSLAVQSLVKRPVLKHNVVDRDKVVIPPGWDSWGKIRVLRDGFDVEQVSRGWSDDISAENDGESGASALAIFEEIIQDPKVDITPSVTLDAKKGHLEVESLNSQEFLAVQLEELDRIRSTLPNTTGADKRAPSQADAGDDSGPVDARVSEHIGPVQFNVGGIQMDAEDMLARLKERQSHQSPEPDTPTGAGPDGKSQNEALASFFAGLVKRGGGTPASPRAAGSS